MKNSMKKELGKAEKLQKLQDIGNTLKTEFIGLSSIIDEIIKSISPWYITPEVVKRPTVISLWGMTGTGKTSVVRRIIELLDVSHKTVFFDCGQEANDSNSSNISDKVCDMLGVEDLDVDTDKVSESMVFVFDEFQYARTLDENGCELLKSNLRPIWNIIDNGILNLNEYRYSIGYFINFVEDITSFSADHPEFTITEGQITGEEQIKEFTESLGLFYCGNNSFCKADRDEEDTKKPIDLIESGVWRTLVRKLNLVSPQLGYRTAKEILKKTRLSEIVEILQESKSAILAPRVLDCSGALVFILGNLDEAFRVEDDISPDMDADVFYDITSKVTVTDIKEALKKRFRAEQIARFGNNLIKYPTLSRDSFVEIIEKELARTFTDFEKSSGIKVTYTPDIVELMYSEGVYPVQGVRPVFTTIGTLVTPLLSDILIGRTIENEKVNIELQDREIDLVARRLKVPKVTLGITFSGTGKTLKKIIPLQLGALRDPSQRRTRYICSVHEAGHAIVSLYLTGKYPDTIVSVATDHGGFVSTHDSDKHSEIKAREDIDNEVMVLLAGYEAEELVYSENPRKRLMGSGNDIEQAWSIFTNAAYNLGYFNPYSYSNHKTDGPNQIPSGLCDHKFLVRGGSCLETSIEKELGRFRIQTRQILKDNKELLVKMALELGRLGSLKVSEFKELVENNKTGTLNVEHIREVESRMSPDFWENILLDELKKGLKK